MENSSEKPHHSTTTITKITTTTTTTIQSAIDDLDKPFSPEEIDAIDAALAAAEPKTPAPSVSRKTPRDNTSGDGNDRPKTRRRRLPGSLSGQNGKPGSAQSSGSGLGLGSAQSSGSGLGSGSGSGSSSLSLTPCSNNGSASRQSNFKMNYPPMHFGGHIVYCRTPREAEKASSQILKKLAAKKCENGWAVLGLDIEWKPSFHRGVPQGRAAVMQICGDMSHSYVFHIIHSGITQSLQWLLEDSTTIKVGVGIGNDAVKVFHDFNVSIKSVEDLSSMANQRLGGPFKQWGLSSLVETLTCKQLLKPKRVRLGNWEASSLSENQIRYAATDAFASWYLYEALKSFPNMPNRQNKN